ncbi:unnamed protein product [Parascedosporium putredinis]|uniref:Cobalamin-independent methionine synthase MetE C-terminal/archaeal domain-containing protein n=1 Tax=Parascedosporium putredinis TaxID=1442378 RepID=A0A9P1GZP3_9PEZI|nr:unnamed protein product [Parascedosporium putredinis]CAI7993108.1 unnamed protein product [Parascedosporium putredinis]
MTPILIGAAPGHGRFQNRTADAGEISAAQLWEEQSKAVADIVKKQQEHGVRAICSGEFDRKWYFGGFFEKLDGFREVIPKAGKQYPMAAVCEGKIKYTKSPYLENWKLLRSQLPESQWGDAKFTMPPPCYFHLRLGPGKCYSSDAYANDKEFFADLAKAYQQEFQTLYAEGLRNVQLDDPTLAYFCSDAMHDSLRQDGEDPEALFETYLQAHNDCIANKPEGLHVGLHICRGNFAKSMHFSEGSYEKISEKMFSTLNYDTFFLEYDNPRSGGFEPLRFLPKGKNVVLGVVTTKEPELEDAELIKTRVRQAAEIIAQGQGVSVDEAMQSIGISPQCGFASVAVGAEGMTEEKMFAKLKLVKDVADELWPNRA